MWDDIRVVPDLQGIPASHRRSEALVPEVPHARQHHRQSQLVGRVDHFLIAHRAARLNDRRRARLRR